MGGHPPPKKTIPNSYQTDHPRITKMGKLTKEEGALTRFEAKKKLWEISLVASFFDQG